MGNQILIYVVEDDVSVRNGMTRFLRTLGHEVQPYSSVKEFVDHMTPAEKSCLIMDAHMPGLSFKKVQNAFSQKFKNLPVIFVATDDDPAIRRIAKSFNAAGFFIKPVDGPALVNAIVWAIDSALILSQEKEVR